MHLPIFPHSRLIQTTRLLETLEYPILDQEDLEVPMVVELDPQDIEFPVAELDMLEDMEVLLVLDQTDMEAQQKDMES